MKAVGQNRQQCSVIILFLPRKVQFAPSARRGGRGAPGKVIRLKRVPILLITILLVVLVPLTLSCGGAAACDPTTTTCPVPVSQRPSMIAKRVFVANKNSEIDIVDANLDVLTINPTTGISNTITGINDPAFFIRGGGTDTIGVMDHTAASVSLIDTDTESISNTIGLSTD